MAGRKLTATREQLEFLDELRESGEMNMNGAAPLVAEQFGISKAEARVVLQDWRDTFAQRHDGGGASGGRTPGQRNGPVEQGESGAGTQARHASPPSIQARRRGRR